MTGEIELLGAFAGEVSGRNCEFQGSLGSGIFSGQDGVALKIDFSLTFACGVGVGTTGFAGTGGGAGIGNAVPSNEYFNLKTGGGGGGLYGKIPTPARDIVQSAVTRTCCCVHHMPVLWCDI